MRGVATAGQPCYCSDKEGGSLYPALRSNEVATCPAAWSLSHVQPGMMSEIKNYGGYGSRVRTEYSASAETRLKLMLAAEELAARHGLAALSAREIAKKAGLRNNVAVQYHFGSLKGLFQALVHHRQSQLEEFRSTMIERDGRDIEELDLYALLKTLLMPHVHLIGKEGHSCYASFLCQYVLTLSPFDYLLIKESPETTPALAALLLSVRQKMVGLSEKTVDRRIGNCTLLFLNVIRSMPPEAFDVINIDDTGLILRDTLMQCIGILSAPALHTE